MRVNACGRSAMPEFAILELNAKKLSDRVAKSYAYQTAGCFGFFTAVVPQILNNSAMEDAITIGMVARSLSEFNDPGLIRYLQSIDNKGIYSNKVIEEYKTKILTGMYLMIWSQYNTSVSSYLNKKLIEFFQMDLEIVSPLEMDVSFFDASLAALSQYCSFIYQNRSESSYSRLNDRLGETIQVNIHTLRDQKFKQDDSWYGVYTGIISSLGLNNMS